MNNQWKHNAKHESQVCSEKGYDYEQNILRRNNWKGNLWEEGEEIKDNGALNCKRYEYGWLIKYAAASP